MFQFLLGFLSSALSGKANATCPDLARGETQADCPFAEITRKLEGVTDSKTISSILDNLAPSILKQLAQDQKHRDLLKLWGYSRNIDESNLTSGKKTVPENLIHFLKNDLKVDYNPSNSIGHAGMTHTYGYLFSNMETPYGYKRARYVRGEIEAGFGLTRGLLSGNPPDGTLLSNLTLLAGRIAFRKDHASTRILKHYVRAQKFHLSSEILNYDYSKLKVRRLIESVKNDDLGLILRTDIVDFPKTNPNGKNTALLIYSMVLDHPKYSHKHAQLITAFPVEPSFAESLFKSSTYGDQLPIKLKYNASLLIPYNPEKLIGKRSAE